MTNELAEKPMSYEEMIDTLKGLVFGTFDRTTSKEREALIRAIDLLSNSDEDCISRQSAIKALSNMMDTDGFRDGWAVSRANVDCMLKSLSPVTPKSKADVLDKIKEEIKENTYFINEITEKEGIDFETVEKIIDKYKAESEE